MKDEWIKKDLGSIEKKRRSASQDNRKLKRVKEDGRESGELNQEGESGVGVGSRERWQMERAMRGKRWKEVRGIKQGSCERRIFSIM